MLEELLEDMNHHHEGECECGHHHHHEGECECGHHHHHEGECECEHHHHHEGECECGHHHHHEGECECGHHYHHEGECECGHHHHHADEVFVSIGFETSKIYSYEQLKEKLDLLANSEIYGEIIRAKGIVKTDCGWKKFNITPNELLFEDSNAIIIGKICVIGSHLDEEIIKGLF